MSTPAPAQAASVPSAAPKAAPKNQKPPATTSKSPAPTPSAQTVATRQSSAVPTVKEARSMGVMANHAIDILSKGKTRVNAPTKALAAGIVQQTVNAAGMDQKINVSKNFVRNIETAVGAGSSALASLHINNGHLSEGVRGGMEDSYIATMAAAMRLGAGARVQRTQTIQGKVSAADS